MAHRSASNTCMFWSLTIFAAQLLWSAAAIAQGPGSNFDLEFENRIRDVTAQLSRSTSSDVDEAQRAFARETFDYYLRYPSTTTGTNAAATAFNLWGRAGATRDIEAALPQLQPDFRAWDTILSDMAIAYVKSNERDTWQALLEQLETDLHDSSAHAAVVARLGDLYFGLREFDAAALRYEQVIALKPGSQQAARAQRRLNEIHRLGIGQPAPAFSATTLDGSELALSQLHGQPVLLDFWATWCGPCIAEFPHLVQLHDKYAADGLQIVGIALDGNLDKLQDVVESHAIPWVQIQETEGRNGTLAQLFSVNSLPRSLLLDREGRIVAKDLRGEKLAVAIAALMGDAETAE